MLYRDDRCSAGFAAMLRLCVLLISAICDSELVHGLVDRLVEGGGVVDHAGDQAPLVDEDVNIHDPAEVERAIATRFQADLVIVPGAQGLKGQSVDPQRCRRQDGL
jgi:hypothetical protein